MRKVFEFESQSTGEIISVLAADKNEALEEFYRIRPADPYPELLDTWSLEGFATLTKQPAKWLQNIRFHERIFILLVKAIDWLANEEGFDGNN